MFHYIEKRDNLPEDTVKKKLVKNNNFFLSLLLLFKSIPGLRLILYLM